MKLKNTKLQMINIRKVELISHYKLCMKIQCHHEIENHLKLEDKFMIYRKITINKTLTNIYHSE